MLSDSAALALMIAIISGLSAIVMSATWTIEHDCGNRYCRHVRRDDDA